MVVQPVSPKRVIFLCRSVRVRWACSGSLVEVYGRLAAGCLVVGSR
jgi:hypothetical protein